MIMAQQAIFLSDDKTQDLEAFTLDSKDAYVPRASAQSSSIEPDPRTLASPVIAFVKWAFICTIIVLAITFTSNSKAR